ncbi:MAG TPA: aldo/keto reductase, partial [Terriglobia bacterium]|nr:aldo/keto reductase [Terriglobia bacterium]
MNRRRFLQAGTAAAGLASVPGAGYLAGWDSPLTTQGDFHPIPRRRLGKTGWDLSILGLGGIVVMDSDQAIANNTVAQAVDLGINYVDVAPSYGNAQERLGPALQPYRHRVFLACKTGKRDKARALAALDDSLKLLRTDYIDLYQHHAVTTMEDVHRILGPNGAMEAFVQARKAGKIRYLGFSAHSTEAALALLDRFEVDTILFPINFVLYSQAHFGPQVIARAREKGVGILAIKAMAKTTWPSSLAQERRP